LEHSQIFGEKGFKGMDGKRYRMILWAL